MIKLSDIADGKRLFTYKVAHDGGSAPNPFFDFCTLAICKPAIRRVAKKGDVIVGLDCGKEELRIIYCMEVASSVPWEEYIRLCEAGEFGKEYNLKGKVPRNKYDQGDCIWKDANNYFDSLDSWSEHSEVGDFNRDVENGKNVLIGEKFWYFGKGNQHSIYLSNELKKIIPGRGHRSNSNNCYRDLFVQFFNASLIACNIASTGKMGNPKLEPMIADKRTCSRCRVEERESDACDEELDD